MKNKKKHSGRKPLPPDELKVLIPVWMKWGEVKRIGGMEVAKEAATRHLAELHEVVNKNNQIYTDGKEYTA